MSRITTTALAFLLAAGPALPACSVPHDLHSPSSGPSTFGGPCAATSECQAGLFCDADQPGGACVRACSSTADCGAGAVCSAQRCARACEHDNDCGRPGYVCKGPGPNAFCAAESEDNTKKAMQEGQMYGR